MVIQSFSWTDLFIRGCEIMNIKTAQPQLQARTLYNPKLTSLGGQMGFGDQKTSHLCDVCVLIILPLTLKQISTMEIGRALILILHTSFVRSMDQCCYHLSLIVVCLEMLLQQAVCVSPTQPGEYNISLLYLACQCSRLEAVSTIKLL